ncbi:MAG: ThiF family adenylyltransferase [Sphingomonas sp.]|nr:ThiF family adenylyltransferase [Sphingomonas sp.]
MPPDPLWTIDCTLKAKGFTYAGPPATYRGPVAVHGKTVTVEVNFSDLTFATLPTVRSIDAAALGDRSLAHLMRNRDICYTDEGGLVLDLYDPGGAALRVLADAAKALERSFGPNALREFEGELAAYWGGKSLYCAISPPPTPEIVAADLLSFKDKKPASLILAPRGAWPLSDVTRTAATMLTFDRALRCGSSFPPSRLQDLLAYIDAQELPPPGWRQAILDGIARGEDMFLAAPNGILGWRSAFGGTLALLKNHPRGFRVGALRKALPDRMGEVTIDNMMATQADLKYCVARNLDGRQGLVGKHIALVGCGTIGGYLAHMLVQNGAGCEAQLSLYDPDILKPGNLGRHVLGFDDLGRAKAEALHTFVQRFHPDVEVDHHTGNALTEWNALERCDLIVDATGDANVATALNDRFILARRGGRQICLLHSWVFGNGAAAQSLLNLDDGHTCYRCLRTGFGGNWRHNPLRDPDMEVRRAPARCGEGGYTPFPVDAPIAAAALAVRAAIDWAGGNPGHRLRTTIVDPGEGRDRLPWVSPKSLDDCPACRS